MAPHFRQRRSVLLNGAGAAGSGSGRRGKRRAGALVTPCLVGLCSVLAVAVACLLATLLLLHHQFQPPPAPRTVTPGVDVGVGGPEKELDGQLRALEHHELWAMERVSQGLNVTGATLEEMVAWLLRHGMRLRAARMILEDHQRAAAATTNTTTTTSAATTTAATASPAATTTPTAMTPTTPTSAATLPERSADAEPLEETEVISGGDVDGSQRQVEAGGGGGGGGVAEAWRSVPRLAEDVLPQRYDLLLHPDLKAGTLTGRVGITMRVASPRRDLWLHAHGMYVNEVGLALLRADDQITPAPGWCSRVPGGLKVEDTLLWAATQFLVVRVDCLLAPGLYELHVSFSASLSAEGRGMYRTAYTASDNETRYIATTKFEPTYARLAFPCFDEPAMKASYKVRLVKPSSSDYVALSNSDVKALVTDPETKLTTVEFTETVKMSSYLAAFIVCDFVKESKPMLTGKPVTVYAREEQIGNAEEALNLAVKVVDYYADFFKIPYPMPKVDLIAIPDFVSGAMENWGLITFRETSVLFDPTENSPANKESISETVAHELAHMWFGNLVTMKWWTDLWLNEGFATFMAQKSVGHIHPEWKFNDQFVVDTLLSVMSLDAELSSHPVLQVVSNPDQITEIFDTISYDKGSSVIIMLEAFMGEENFAKGLHKYLDTHKFSNAETADLWNALQDYAPEKVNVAAVMDTWTRQMGFPLVTVKKTAPGKYVLTQKRFLSNPEAKYDPTSSKYGYKWEIPISFATSASKSNSLQWLWSDKENLEITVDSSVDWIKLNYKQRSYFRVNYDDDGWNSLIKTLIGQNMENIDAVDRAGLISDAFSLADAEELNYQTALDLTKYLKNEKSLVAWDAASTAITTLLQRLPDSQPLKNYGNTLLEPIVQELGWTVSIKDDHLKNRLRALVLDLACSLKDPHALTQANKLFALWLKGGDKPDPNIRAVVYRYGLGNSQDESEWNLLLNKFKAETNTQEKLKLMFALATTANEALLQQYLIIAKDETVIRSQDYFTVLTYIAENSKGVQLVWDFYRNEYDYLLKRFTLNDRIFGRFITRIAAKFATTDRLNEMKDFFSSHPDAGAGTAARKQALEGVENRIKWLQTHKKAVEDWLERL